MKNLGVDKDTFLKQSSVSKEAALDMAKKVKHIINTDVRVSCTGVTGPTRGTHKKPTGLFITRRQYELDA